jgi:hypothetical protein
VSQLPRALFALAVALAGPGCDDEGFDQSRADASDIDAMSGDPCDGVTTACLTNQGSTMMEDVRISEGGIPNLMTDILRQEAMVRAGEVVDVAFINGGAIRGGANSGPPDFEWSSETARIGNAYGPGPLTDDDIRGWFPFRNDNVVMTLTGAQIKRSLELGVNTFADDAGTTFGADLLSGDGAGPFLHASGLAYEVTCPGTIRIQVGPSDCDPFAGTCVYLNPDDADTVSKITIGETVIFDAALGGWQGDGETAEFRVVMNSFMAAGNDNHLDFKDGTDRLDISIDYWDYIESVVDVLNATSPTTLDGAQGRIVVVGTVGGLPCNLPASCTPAHAETHPNCQHL